MRKFKPLLIPVSSLLFFVILVSSALSAGRLPAESSMEEDMMKVYLRAYKIICTSPEDMPGWGEEKDYPEEINHDIIYTYLASHPDSRIDPQWEFEWALGDVEDPMDYTEEDLYGPVGGDWTVFSKITEIYIPRDTKIISVREVLREGYLGFAGLTTELPAPGSAQLYAHTDGYKFDNLERIYSPVDGGRYYIIAFNLPLEY